MYNNVVNISQGGESIERHFSQPLPFANRRGLEDVQRMNNRLQKQNDAFSVFLKNQINKYELRKIHMNIDRQLLGNING